MNKVFLVYRLRTCTLKIMGERLFSDSTLILIDSECSRGDRCIGRATRSFSQRTKEQFVLWESYHHTPHNKLH